MILLDRNTNVLHLQILHFYLVGAALITHTFFSSTYVLFISGMSTCIDVVGARHCGMKVLGLSFISNMCILDSDGGEILTVDEIMKVHDGIQQESLKSLQNLVSKLVEKV